MTTSTSGTSMIPALRNCSTSPAPGWTTTATVSAASATSVSDCPTPTVSMTTTSNAAASACAAARVAGASPPSRSPAAIERMNSAAVGRVGVDPRAVAEQRAARALRRRVDGQHRDRPPARAPDARERAEQRRLAGAGRPGDADDVRRRLAAEPRRRRPRRAARRSPSRRAGERFSSRFSAAGAAARSRSRSRAPSAARAPSLGAPSAPLTPRRRSRCAPPRSRRRRAGSA